MTEGSTYDVLLVGYRNDVARARTLRFLDGAAAPDRAELLPRLLYRGLDAADAQRIRTQLERLGAQIGLVRTGDNATRAIAPVFHSPPVNVGVIRTLSMGFVAIIGLGTLLLLGLGVRLQRVGVAPSQRATPAVYATPDQAALQLRHVDSEQPQALRINNEAVELARASNFRDAVHKLREALTLAPGDPVLTKNLQGVLLNWGLATLNAEQFDAALTHLDEAAALGDHAEVLYALGVIYVHQANYDLAGPPLERALELAPSDVRILQLLADVRLKQDRRADALALLQRARDAGARGAALDTRVAQLSREVDAEWDFVEQQSPHFRLSFGDDKDVTTVHSVLSAFEDAYYAVGSKLNVYPDDRTAVVLYTQQDFHSITQTPDWAGAAFDGRIKLPVRGLTPDDESLSRVARHEYAHSIVGALTKGRCPVWLNEGLAVWAEELKDGERRPWAEGKIAGQSLFTLQQLSGTFTRLPAGAAEVAYAESYLAVQLLIERHGARSIPELLRALGQQDIRRAFDNVCREDLAIFEERLQHELRG